jgi:hypothetical protein
MSEYVEIVASAVKAKVPAANLKTIEAVIRIHRTQFPSSWQSDSWALDFDSCVSNFSNTMREAIEAEETGPERIVLLYA